MTTPDPSALASQVLTSVNSIAQMDEEIHRQEKYLKRIQNLLSMSDGKPDMEDYRAQLRQHRKTLEDSVRLLKNDRETAALFIAESGFGQL